MKQFATLYTQLDQTTKTNAKVDALARYFEQADGQDRIWTVAILSHRRPKRTVNSTLLRTWAAEMAAVPLWLFEESYHVVGDLSEASQRRCDWQQTRRLRCTICRHPRRGLLD